MAQTVSQALLLPVGERPIRVRRRGCRAARAYHRARAAGSVANWKFGLVPRGVIGPLVSNVWPGAYWRLPKLRTLPTFVARPRLWTLGGKTAPGNTQPGLTGADRPLARAYQPGRPVGGQLHYRPGPRRCRPVGQIPFGASVLAIFLLKLGTERRHLQPMLTGGLWAARTLTGRRAIGFRRCKPVGAGDRHPAAASLRRFALGRDAARPGPAASRPRAKRACRACPSGCRSPAVAGLHRRRPIARRPGKRPGRPEPTWGTHGPRRSALGLPFGQSPVRSRPRGY